MFAGIKGWIYAIALLIAGGVALASGFQEAREHQAFSTQGKTARGLITEIEWKKKRGVSRGYKGTVEFQTAEGQHVTAKVKLPRKLGEALKNDDQLPLIELLYLPSQPTQVVVAGSTDDSGATKAVGAVLLLLGALLLWRKLAKRKPDPEVQDTATA